MSYTNESNPDFDRANQGTLQGVIDQAIRNAMLNLEVMLPATIVAYDRSTNIASVQPQILMVTTDGTELQRATQATIPVFSYSGGGFTINFPQKAGNRGWIKASDRDISLYAQSGNASKPNTSRLHSFSDGLFIPDCGSAYSIDSEDTENAVMQTLDGTIRVSVWADRVKITAPNYFILAGPDRVQLDGLHVYINSPDIKFSTSPVVTTIPPVPPP